MTEIQKRLCALAEEMKELIGNHFAKPPNGAVHKRLQEIRDEIHRCGWEVRYSVGFSLQKPDQLMVEVELLEPKKNLSPEDQALYDQWFRSVNNIKEGE